MPNLGTRKSHTTRGYMGYTMKGSLPKFGDEGIGAPPCFRPKKLKVRLGQKSLGSGWELFKRQSG